MWTQSHSGFYTAFVIYHEFSTLSTRVSICSNISQLEFVITVSVLTDDDDDDGLSGHLHHHHHHHHHHCCKNGSSYHEFQVWNITMMSVVYAGLCIMCMPCSLFVVMLQNMVLSFRQTELQVLLGVSSESRDGRKTDLMQRALSMIDRGVSSAIESKIRDLYRKSGASTSRSSLTYSRRLAAQTSSSSGTSASSRSGRTWFDFGYMPIFICVCCWFVVLFLHMFMDAASVWKFSTV